MRANNHSWSALGSAYRLSFREVTDPDARLYRRDDRDKAVLACPTHVLLDNRCGVAQGACATAADGSEREAAQLLLEVSGRHRGAVGADTAYNVPNFVAAVRQLGLLRKLRHRGGRLVNWIITFTAATYHMVRMRRVLVEA